MKIQFAIDLLWIRPSQVGGIESYIRNLLDGFTSLKYEFEVWLLVSKDNKDTFIHYSKDKRFHVYMCNIKSANIGKRIIWQNFNLNRTIKKLGLSVCFEPYYCKPFLGTRDIKFITTIHDLQAIHYPKYFSILKVLWMKVSWYNTINTSKTVIAISEYVKRDIISHYKTEPNKIKVIYNSILIDTGEMLSDDLIERKYMVKKNEFYFTVSSLLPHKNIHTLIRVFAKIKQQDIDLPCKLIISGVGGKLQPELEKLINKSNLKENILLTGFIDNAERNALYKYSKAFLFPSIFEGFGMPPIEALFLGTPVITTREACLEEVTQGKANYVDDPFNIDEWVEKMKTTLYKKCDFSVYESKLIAKNYLNEIEKIVKI